MKTTPSLRCPDCTTPLGDTPLDGGVVCPTCEREFEFRSGFLDCLPSQVSSLQVKEDERLGWQELYPKHLDEVRQFYLEFPYITEDNGGDFYGHASEQLGIVMQLMDPLAGKSGLDLGGGFGWGAYRLTEKGASMTLADFNDSTPSGLGGAQIYSENGIHFSKIRVDAEELPFTDNQFDFVFSCSFLHHLTRPDVAISHIGRVLRPGGRFFAIMEAFCPFWSSRNFALKRAHDIERYTGNGINEQVFTQREYRKWFNAAGLDFKMINPRWDLIEDGIVKENDKLKSPDYRPECLANRAQNPGVTGALVRQLLSSNLWRLPAHHKVFPLLRNPLLGSSQKIRILYGEKKR